MRSINKVILVGNLTRDPEIRRTLSGQNITNFGIATNREWMTKGGRHEKSSEFHEIVCWGGLAEIATKLLKKGKLVYIEGYLKTRSWDDPTGLKKFRTEVVSEDLIVLEKRPKSEGDMPMESGETDREPRGLDTEMQQSVTIEDPFTI